MLAFLIGFHLHKKPPNHFNNYIDIKNNEYDATLYKVMRIIDERQA